MGVEVRFVDPADPENFRRATDARLPRLLCRNRCPIPNCRCSRSARLQQSGANAKPVGPIAYVLRARCVLLRDIGARTTPFSAFQFLQGLETLPLRIRQHNSNAQAVAEFLQARPDVVRVIFPGFQSGEAGRRAVPI